MIRLMELRPDEGAAKLAARIVRNFEELGT